MNSKTLSLLSGTAAAFVLALSPAMASDRYGQRPPVVLSPDLSAPWLMQLGGSGAPRGGIVVSQPQGRAPAAAQQRRQVIEAAAPVAPRARQPAPARTMDPRFLPQSVSYETGHGPGTIIIDTNERFLYLVEGNGMARRYGVGVGKPGFEWAGTHKVTRKAEWPDWRPPAEMIARVKLKEGRILPAHMPGGPENPLGARAMYLGSTLYRIHGTNQPWTIGGAVSSGCIRMRNEDVVDLYDRVKVGTKVIVM